MERLRGSNVENFERTDQFGNTVGRVSINVISHRLICKLERLQANKISIATLSTCVPEYSTWWISWLKQNRWIIHWKFSKNFFCCFGSCVAPMKSLRVLLNGLVSGSYFRFGGQSLFRLKCSRIRPLCGAAVRLCWVFLFGRPAVCLACRNGRQLGTSGTYSSEKRLCCLQLSIRSFWFSTIPFSLAKSMNRWNVIREARLSTSAKNTATLQFYNVPSTCKKLS